MQLIYMQHKQFDYFCFNSVWPLSQKEKYQIIKAIFTQKKDDFRHF